MTMFDSIKSKNIDEFAEWLDKHGAYDDSSYMKWWDDNYCLKCEPETAYVKELDKVCDCAWCELYGKCKYFQELDDIPSNIQIIKMWLELNID